MDEHVPGAITQGLRDRDVDVLTVQEDGREGQEDGDMLDRATELERLVFTEDQDFFQEAAHRQRSSQSFSGVFYLAQGRLSYRQCIDELELIAKCSNPDEWLGQVNSIPIGS
jgi:predicted nuclease of predicted toxin-antitoxin system